MHFIHFQKIVVLLPVLCTHFHNVSDDGPHLWCLGSLFQLQAHVSKQFKDLVG